MDAYIDKIGGFGRYQKAVLFIIGTCTGLVGFTTYSSIFGLAGPNLLCRDFNSTFSNRTTFSEDNTCDIWNNISKSNDNNIKQVYSCEFDETYYGTTIVKEWELFCDKASLASYTQSIFMVGCFSTFFIGYFSDKYGRRSVLLAVAILTNIVMIINNTVQLPQFNISVTARYTVYAISQFILGFSTYVIEIVAYVLALEITSAQYASIVSIVFLNMYVLGELYVLLVYYLSRDWHILYWCVAGYSLIITACIAFFLPESPRILVVNKKYAEAAKVLNKMNKYNGNQGEITEETLLTELGINKKEMECLKENHHTEVTVKTGNSAWYFLSHPYRNLVKFLLMAYVWVAVSLVYFGVSLGITSISSNLNPYVMYLLSSLAEMVGYTGGILGSKYSRNKILKVCLTLAGICCIVVAFIPVTSNSITSWNSILIMLCVFIGKAMSATAFNLIYIYTNQLYPTFVRNTIVSYTASAGRFGSIISPLINLLGTTVWKPLPYLIFSSASFIAAGCLFFIPDASKDFV